MLRQHCWLARVRRRGAGIWKKQCNEIPPGWAPGAAPAPWQPWRPPCLHRRLPTAGRQRRAAGKPGRRPPRRRPCGRWPGGWWAGQRTGQRGRGWRAPARQFLARSGRATARAAGPPGRLPRRWRRRRQRLAPPGRCTRERPGRPWTGPAGARAPGQAPPWPLEGGRVTGLGDRARKSRGAGRSGAAFPGVFCPRCYRGAEHRWHC